LDIFTFNEPTVTVSEPPIDISFEDLFADEIMCLDESTRGRLADCPLPDVDLSFGELFGDELEFMNNGQKEVLNERGGEKEFLSEQNGEMWMNANKLKLEMPRVIKIMRHVSHLNPRKRTHWNDGKRARGKRPKDSPGSEPTCT